MYISILLVAKMLLHWPVFYYQMTIELKSADRDSKTSIITGGGGGGGNSTRI